MKATLEFNLPEEQSEYETTNNANNYYCALWDLSQQLRDDLKHGNLSSIEYNIVSKYSDRFYDILKDNNVNLGG